MGCSCGSRTGDISKKPLLDEKTDENNKNKMEIYTLQNNDYNMFYKEKIEIAIERGAVRPWLTNIVPPEHEIEENTNYPKYSLKIDHVFGYRNDESNQNVFFLSEDQIVYTTSSLGIIQNIDDLSQNIFGGNTNLGKRTCHNNDIVSIAWYKGEISMVATGQKSMKPMILIWSPLDPGVIFAKFHWPIGTKEVKGIDFDRKGCYVGCFGRDENNTVFLFHIQSKSLYWKKETGNNMICDIKFNPYKDEFCLCGDRLILFCNYAKKQVVSMINPSDTEWNLLLFTCISYIESNKAAISSHKGKMFIWKNYRIRNELSISHGIITVHLFSPTLKRLYIADTMKNIIILNTYRSKYEQLYKFQMHAIVNAIDINEEEELVLGWKNGDIVIINFRDPQKMIKTIVKSHGYGSVRGWDFVNDKQAWTVGEDDKIMLWNLRTHMCENVGKIAIIEPDHEGYREYMDYLKSMKGKLSAKYSPFQKAWALSYNKQKGHIAIGMCNGFISIREGVKKLNKKVLPDIKIADKSATDEDKAKDNDEYEETMTNIAAFINPSKTEALSTSGTGKAITELKYTNYGDLLAVACETRKLVILNVNENYQIIKQIGMNDIITTLDWDMSNKYIQVVTINNTFHFIDYQANLIKNPIYLRGVEWPNYTCKFGYPVQGVYMGSTDPYYINCVCKAHTKNIICSGDDDMRINLYNYPTISENPKVKSYCGHSSDILRIAFSPDDSKVITISGVDKSVFLWAVEEDKHQ